jgi:hypothetical protein
MILCKILLYYGCASFHSRAALVCLSWLVFCLNGKAKESTCRLSIFPTGQLRAVFSIVLILVLFLNNPALPSAMDTFGSLAKPVVEDVLYNVSPLIGLQHSKSFSPASMPAFVPASIEKEKASHSFGKTSAQQASIEKTKASHSFGKTSAQQFFKYVRVKSKKTVRNLKRKFIKKIPLRWKLNTAKWVSQKMAPFIGKSLPWIATKFIPRIVAKGIPGLNAISLVYDGYKIAKWTIPKIAPLIFKAITR